MDDLFTDEPSDQKKENSNKAQKIMVENNNQNLNEKDSEQQNSGAVGIITEDSFGDIKQDEVPKQTPIVEDDEDTYDLQKELEAKFDELFGPIDDDE